MEATMICYKTIVLEMLQDHPAMYDKLLSTRTLLATLEEYASDLRNRHQIWMELLSEAKPDRDPIQIASEAGELAIEELQKRLACGQTLHEDEAFSLDRATAFISRNHSSHA
jgi:hypothetical protein